MRWGVAVVGSGGAATIAEVRAKEKGDLEARALGHPMVQAVLAASRARRSRGATADALAAAGRGRPATTGDEDDGWDPFDPFSEES